MRFSVLSPLRRRAIVGLAAGALLLSACSGAAAGPTATSVANAPAGGLPGGGIAGLPDIDPCSKLAQADVQALFSTPLGTYTTDHTGNCTWPLGDPSKGDGLDVVVNAGQGTGPLDQDMGLTGELTSISGVGDRASWGLLAGYFPHLGAVKGQYTCEITIAGGNAELSVPTTGKGVFAAIDATALPGFMQQFGVLCSQIFAGLGA
jgi:hypothetical protein